MTQMYIIKGNFIHFLIIIGVLLVASCSNGTDLSELVKRKGIVYKKKTNEPFIGISVSYYEKSKKNKKAETEYKKGLIDGIVTVWYQSGELKCRKKYLKGLLHGETMMWYTNGHKKSVETFSKGKQYGRQIYWKKDGTLIKDRIIH